VVNLLEITYFLADISHAKKVADAVKKTIERMFLIDDIANTATAKLETKMELYNKTTYKEGDQFVASTILFD